MSLRLSNDCTLVDEELDGQFRSPTPELSPAAAQHVGTCPRCRELYRLAAADLEVVDVSPELRSKIHGALLSSLKVVEPVLPNRVTVVKFLLIFAALALALISMMGKAGFYAMDVLQVVAMTIILSIGAVLLSISLTWQMIPGSYRSIPINLIVTGSIVGPLTAIALIFPWRTSQGDLLHGWPCFVAELAIGIPAAAIFWIVSRRGAPHSGPALGASLAGLAGLLAVAVLQIQCPHQEAPHLLVWHLGAPLTLILAGILIGSFLRKRSLL
jgi:hypothetical protein